MKVTEPEESRQYTALYEATVQEAVGGAATLMTRLVAHTRAALRELESKATELRERDAVTDSRRRLNQFEATLCERFAEDLMSAFARAASVERAQPAASANLHFDELAAMDDAQLSQSVASARVRHKVQAAADLALGELNRQICTLLGLSAVRLEKNPLRPTVYVEALTAALTHLPVPSTVRQGWISIMSGALGQELDAYYRRLSAHLRERGVGSGGIAVSPEPRAPRQESSLLTLEKLRRLLADAPRASADEISQRYEHAPQALGDDSTFVGSEQVPTGFRPTIPAAFDAARRMNQLDEVVQRVESRKNAPGPADAAMHPAREQLRRAAHGLEQALGVEVVTMMVDNIAHDQRLLTPVQQLVAELEPALLQLALVDPRFFSHKQHPARRLLHEITHRSIAFESVDSRGFSGFMEPLREAIAPLSAGKVENASQFDKVLGELEQLWDDPAGKEKRQLAKAVRALQKAEQRKALAATMVEDIHSRPDAQLVPQAVLDFLCGPWAHVIAHARMTDKTGADDPGFFGELIEGLMWSAQPELTRKKVSTLTRLVPKLLGRLREGLATIDYPPHKTSEFFEVLMNQHQRGFKRDEAPMAPRPRVRPQPSEFPPTVGHAQAKDGLWVAPLEARASGFIDLAPDDTPLPAQGLVDQLVVGTWVALMAEGSWTRTRLTWTSPNGTLLLFTDALGYMQSLTRRSCEQLAAMGHLHVVSMHPVEDALDAVAEAAMRNSVDIRF